MKKISYYIIFLVVIGAALVSLWVYQKYFKEETPNFLLFEVERGDIQEVVKARGEVVSQKEFNLEFPFSGTIKKVFVKEGQWVNFGNPLMKLETTDFELEQRKLEASLAESRANFNKLIAGVTEEELNVLETEVFNAQKSVEDAELYLQNIQSKANSDLANVYGDTMDILNDAYTKADDALNTKIDDMFDNDDSSNPNLTFIVTDSQAEIDAEWQRLIAGNELEDFKTELDTLLVSDFSALDQAFIDAEDHLVIIRDFLNRLSDAINNSAGISSSTVSTYKSNLSVARININAAISNINNQEQIIVIQRVVNQNNIDSAGISLNETRSVLELARSNLALAEAEARIEDIEIAKAKINGIESQISITRENIRKSTIYAPTTAKIIKVWFEEREIFRPGQTAVSLSTSGYKIQADISELDIGKIQEVDGNDVLIELDAFPGQEFNGKITSIEPEEVIKEGDKYYRVNIFMEKQEITIRSGMSADLVIQTSFKEEVLKIPEFAVYEKEDKEFVKILGEGQKEVESLESLLEVEIETGISDGELIEVVKGLEEGQIIVVSAD